MLAAAVLSLVCTEGVQAQTKAELKAVKARARELAQEGWKVEGVGSLQSELTKIESKRSTAEVLSGTAYDCRKLTLAKAEARNNAITEYAEYAKSVVAGRITSGMSDLNEEEADNFVSGFERMVLREMDGEISMPALVLIRTNERGLYDCRCFYLIDSNAAEKTRKRAMTQALEEADIANEYGDRISEFIREGFDDAK